SCRLHPTSFGTGCFQKHMPCTGLSLFGSVVMTISASLLSQQASAPAPQANTATAATAVQTETKPATTNLTQTPAVTPFAESSNSLAKKQTSQQDRHSGAQTNTQANAEEPKAPPAQPKTEILDSSATGAALATDGHDPILDPAPLPTGITTLVGGVIADVDRV